MTDLVMMSLEPWDEVWRRNQYFAAGLLKEGHVDRILFVEPAADPLHSVRLGGRPKRGAGLREIRDVEGVADGRLFAFQPTKYLPRRIDRRADQRLARATIRVAAKLGMDSPVLWINDPGGVEVMATTSWPSVYDVTDDWLLAERSASEHDRLVRQEDALLNRCDEVIVCSPDLVRTKGQSREVHLVHNAVDVAEYFKEMARPVDLPQGPVALYVGTLHRDRLDVELCELMASSHETKTRLVLVGPNALDRRDTARLEAAGVLILGSRPKREVPAYLRHADVLVVPHTVTPFTESLDPIKAYEYAAARRPIVSTPVAGFRDNEAVVVGQGADFVDAVQRLAVPRRPDALGETVPDWSDRVQTVANILARVG